MESKAEASKLGYYYVETPAEDIHSIAFAEKNEYLIAATSRGLRVYLTKNFGCVHFIGKYPQYCLLKFIYKRSKEALNLQL
jgi:hypothetical protein